MDNMVSVVITSYNRYDLLRRTIQTFNEFNTYPIEKYIIIEDSVSPSMQTKLKSYISRLTGNYELIFNETNQGQVESIDIAYAHVETPYVFHSEDDYEYFRPGFIERSLAVLEHEEMCMQVWIRSLDDTIGQPIESELYSVGDVNYYHVGMHTNQPWYGFCFQCGLRKMSVYHEVAPYTQWSPKTDFPSQRECKIGIELWKLGYHSAILPEGYARHMGRFRSVSGNFCT